MRIFDLERAHESIELRELRPYRIAYHLVGPAEKIGNEIPWLLRGRFIRAIADLPKSGLQLTNPFWYQWYHIERNLAQPTSFGVTFDHNFSKFAEYLEKSPALLHVLAWVTDNPDALGALRLVKAPFVVAPNEEKFAQALIKGGVSPAAICRTTEEIFSRIESAVIEQIVGSPEEYERRKSEIRATAEEWRGRIMPGPQLPFFPLTPNEAQIRQILGQFRPDFWSRDRQNRPETRADATVKAFDAARIAYADVAASNPGPWRFRGEFPAAIVAFPSINPLLNQQLDRIQARGDAKLRAFAKQVLALRTAEQDSTTFHCSLVEPSGPLNETAFRFGLGEVTAYTHFFDDMGYLHGSFQCAPYLRAPLKGKSLSQQHSFFSPRNFPASPKAGVVLRYVSRFSKVLREVLDPKVHHALCEYPGGLVALSDLPIEWLDGDGVPLAFTHDVCRIPETVPTNLLSQFNRNSELAFVIRPDLLKKTLVICGAPAGDIIAQSFTTLNELWRKQGATWRWEHCTSLNDLYRLVNEFRPEFLIFDTHGRFTDNQLGTELMIGAEFLNGDQVIKNFPQVPLVMLSTCWGAPLYGCPNTIAHAFFEAGSLAVTTSMLPLNALKGATLYTRVLNNLRTAARRPMHPNWSAFISHNVRTSYIDDLKNQLLPRFRDHLLEREPYVSARAHWQLNAMMAPTRRAAYFEAPTLVINCFEPAIHDEVKTALARNMHVPEFMFYSTMGRADLISFAAWNAKYYKRSAKLRNIGQMIEKLTVQSARNSPKRHEHH